MHSEALLACHRRLSSGSDRMADATWLPCLGGEAYMGTTNCASGGVGTAAGEVGHGYC